MTNPFDVWLKRNRCRPAWAAAALGVPPVTIFAWTRQGYWPARGSIKRIAAFTGGDVTPADFLMSLNGKGYRDPQHDKDLKAGALLLQRIKEYENGQTEEERRKARAKLSGAQKARPPARASKGKSGDGAIGRRT